MVEERRSRRLIARALGTFGLELCGLTVLTEAASGYFVLTPLIAALAGADAVYAMARDSRYGSAAEVQRNTMGLAERWGVANRLHVLLDRADDRVGRADIVTNLGHVRPLDRVFLRRLKPSAVVPLMWETWEFRPEDLDLAVCRSLGIPVLGTNEHHPDLQTFRFVGMIAVKLLLSAAIEVCRSNVVVLGSGEFGDHAAQALRDSGADVTVLHPDALSETGGDGLLSRALKDADAVVVAEHGRRSPVVGGGGAVTVQQFVRGNPAVVVAHICGDVDVEGLRAAGLTCVPSQSAPSGFMSVGTDYVGPRPLIDLHAAGLRVGQEMAKATLMGMSGLAAEEHVLRTCQLAQGFRGRHAVEGASS